MVWQIGFCPNSTTHVAHDRINVCIKCLLNRGRKCGFHSKLPHFWGKPPPLTRFGVKFLVRYWKFTSIHSSAREYSSVMFSRSLKLFAPVSWIVPRYMVNLQHFDFGQHISLCWPTCSGNSAEFSFFTFSVAFDL